MDERILKRAAGLYRKKAQDKRESAAYGGSYGDGGASLMESKLNAFLSGWNREIPEWLDEHVEEARIEIEREAYKKDPEYAKFLELKEKFKNA